MGTRKAKLVVTPNEAAVPAEVVAAFGTHSVISGISIAALVVRSMVALSSDRLRAKLKPVALFVAIVLVELVATGVPGVSAGKAIVVTGKVRVIAACTVTVRVGVSLSVAAWADEANG